MCNDRNYLTIVVTNQAGIARDCIQRTTYRPSIAGFRSSCSLTARISTLSIIARTIPKGPYLTWPKHAACRKPGVGMFEDACADWDNRPVAQFHGR